MKISIVVPVYNSPDDVRLCIDSLIKNLDFNVAEVILADDCSADETKNYLEECAREYNSIKLLRNDSNLGFAKTCNRGMKSADGEIIVLLNSDTKTCADFCKYVIDCFESDADIGLASPLQTGAKIYGIPMPKNVSLDEMNERIRNIHKPVYPVVPYAEGFCFCIRKTVIDKIGYIDEIFGAGYGEEVDYSYRAWENGIKCVLIDNLLIYHKNHASFGKKLRIQQMSKNNPILEKRWSGFRKKLNDEQQFHNISKNIQTKLFWHIKLKRFIYSKEKVGNKKIITILGIRR